MDGGIGVERFLFRRSSTSTEPLPSQRVSGQSHGDDVAFQCWRERGLPHCCLRLRRVARSVAEN